MKQIRIHGRGGQGSLALAQFMAIAALEDGRFGQAFPFLGGGGERRGKAIMAFCRLSDKPIRIRCKVDAPDYIIVQDATIFRETDILAGLKPNGLVLVNSHKPVVLPGVARERLVTASCEELAREILGRPIMNTALLGTFAGLTGEFSLPATLRAVKQKFSGDLGEKNARLLETCYHQIQKGSS